MNTCLRRQLSTLLILSGISAAALATDPPPPPPPPPACKGALSCPSPEFVAQAKGSCPITNEKQLFCEHPVPPPPYKEIMCSTFAGGAYCEAWPKAKELHYSWTHTPGLHLDYTPDPSDSFVYFNCAYGAAGRATVAIIAPSYATSTVYEDIRCGDM